MWVLISFILTLTSVIVIMGKIGDLIGKAAIYNIGWGILMIGAILSAYVQRGTSTLRHLHSIHRQELILTRWHGWVLKSFLFSVYLF